MPSLVVARYTEQRTQACVVFVFLVVLPIGVRLWPPCATIAFMLLNEGAAVSDSVGDGGGPFDSLIVDVYCRG